MLKHPFDRLTTDSNIRLRAACTGFVLFVSVVFLFAHLGVYALWDDESETALLAQGVLATGDTTALVGRNLNARRGGTNLRNLADRLTPPLPTYCMAVSLAIGGETAFFARMPFAMCGLATVGTMLLFLWQSRATTWNFLIFATALLANVPFFLYCRNARYYGAALMLATAAGALYVRGLGTWRRRAAFSAIGGLLLFCHPIAFLQAATASAADWFFFKPKTLPKLQDLVALCGPFLLIALPGLCVWNPLFVKSSSSYLEHITILDRLVLLWWHTRDLFTAEFIPLAALAYVPLAFYLKRDSWLLRCCLAVGAIVVATTAVTHQLVSVTSVADVRYMTAAIPVGIAAAVRSFEAVPPKHRIIGLVVAVLAFATNAGSGKFDFDRGPDSTLLRFVNELIHPIDEPYTPVAKWLHKHAQIGSSVLVVPDYMMYPLMFHAPEFVYAWQIADDRDPQFSGLAAIHFLGRVPPDYVVAFGPVREAMEQAMVSWQAAGVAYDQVAALPVFWKDAYRPEIFWRTFASVKIFDESSEGIFIFARSGIVE